MSGLSYHDTTGAVESVARFRRSLNAEAPDDPSLWRTHALYLAEAWLMWLQGRFEEAWQLGQQTFTAAKRLVPLTLKRSTPWHAAISPQVDNLSRKARRNDSP